MEAGTVKEERTKTGTKEVSWETTERERWGGQRENEFAIQRSGIQSNNYSTASSIGHLGEPNPATANFNSSLLRRLSASWLAVREGGEGEEMGRREARNTIGRVLVPQHYCFLSSPVLIVLMIVLCSQTAAGNKADGKF